MTEVFYIQVKMPGTLTPLPDVAYLTHVKADSSDRIKCPRWSRCCRSEKSSAVNHDVPASTWKQLLVKSLKATSEALAPLLWSSDV